MCDISAEQLSLLLGVAFVNMHGVSPLGTPLCHPYRVAPQSWRHPSADPPVSVLLTALFPWGVGGVEGGTHFIFVNKIYFVITVDWETPPPQTSA